MPDLDHAPMPLSGVGMRRKDHTRLRRRILYGDWEDDLYERMRLLVGKLRREAWGKPDMTANPFRALCVQMSTIYDRTPEMWNGADTRAGRARKHLETKFTRAKLWALMQRFQRDCIGLREMVMRVDVTSKGDLTFRPVFPDLCDVVTDPDDPNVIIELYEARQRRDPEDGLRKWYWDVVIVDGDMAVYRVYEDKHGEPNMDRDVSGAFLENSDGTAATAGLIGPEFPHQDGEGNPVMPAVLYHAAETGRTWDPYEWRELVEATLNLGVLWSFWSHIVRDASWPQRYGVGVRPLGAGQSGGMAGETRSEIVTDPASMVMFEHIADLTDSNAAPVIGQFQAGGDPMAIAEAISVYERRLAGYVGLSPSDVHRLSGDPRSGYAIAITRAAQRDNQRRLEPVFAVSDSLLISLCCKLLNAYAEEGAPVLPEEDWEVRYEAIPMDAGERQGLIDEVMLLLEKGFIDKPEAMRRLSAGMSRSQAEREIARIEMLLEKEKAENPPPPPPLPPQAPPVPPGQDPAPEPPPQE